MTEQWQIELDQPIPADAIRSRQQAGRNLSYVDGHYVYSEMNRILGNGKWGYDVAELAVCYEGKDEKGRARVSYRAVVNLKTSVGMSIEDVGYGHGIGAPGDAHESAGKEAVTDAVKRCCKTLGQRMGLQLYGKGAPVTGAYPPVLNTDAPSTYAAPAPTNGNGGSGPSWNREFRFGKNKGQPLVSAPLDYVQWYAQKIEEGINDPTKAEYRDKNVSHYKEVLIAIATLEGNAPPAPAPEPTAEDFSDEPLPY